MDNITGKKIIYQKSETFSASISSFGTLFFIPPKECNFSDCNNYNTIGFELSFNGNAIFEITGGSSTYYRGVDLRIFSPCYNMTFLYTIVALKGEESKEINVNDICMKNSSGINVTNSNTSPSESYLNDYRFLNDIQLSNDMKNINNLTCTLTRPKDFSYLNVTNLNYKYILYFANPK